MTAFCTNCKQFKNDNNENDNDNKTMQMIVGQEGHSWSYVICNTQVSLIFIPLIGPPGTCSLLLQMLFVCLKLLHPLSHDHLSFLFHSLNLGQRRSIWGDRHVPRGSLTYLTQNQMFNFHRWIVIHFHSYTVQSNQYRLCMDGKIQSKQKATAHLDCTATTQR